jgi:hypothetical protein
VYCACAVAQLVDALRYKPENGGFNSRWVFEIFHRLNLSGRTMAMGLMQPLTEINARDLF